MASFERFFSEYLATELSQSVGIVLDESEISAELGDRQELSAWHEEVQIVVSCVFPSKEKADSVLEQVRGKVSALPSKHPVVMSAKLLAQGVESVGLPRKWLYTGAFVFRIHTEDSY